MMKIAALASGRNTPSTRFRIRQHLELLRNAVLGVSEYMPVNRQNSVITPPD